MLEVSNSSCAPWVKGGQVGLGSASVRGMRHFSFENVCQNICWLLLHSGVLGRRMAGLSLSPSPGLSGTPRTSILIIFWRIFDASFAFHTTPRAAATPRRLWPRATATATVAACRLWRFFRQVGFPSSAVHAVKPLFYALSLSLFLSCLFRSQA